MTNIITEFLNEELSVEEFLYRVEQLNRAKLPEEYESIFKSWFSYPSSSTADDIKEAVESGALDHYLEELRRIIRKDKFSDSDKLKLSRGISETNDFESHSDGEVVSLTESGQVAQDFAGWDRGGRGLILGCEVDISTVVFHHKYTANIEGNPNDEFEVVVIWDSDLNNCEVARGGSDTAVNAYIEEIDRSQIKSDLLVDNVNVADQEGEEVHLFQVEASDLQSAYRGHDGYIQGAVFIGDGTVVVYPGNGPYFSDVDENMSPKENFRNALEEFIN